MMAVKHVDEEHCDRRHGRLWNTFWCGFTLLLTGLGGLAAYGFTMHNRAAVNANSIEGIKETQRGIKRDVEETRRMVYDIWRKNGGQK